MTRARTALVLIAAGAVLVVLTAKGGATSGIATLTGYARALDDWYDRRDGIGSPCTPRDLVPYRGPAGLVLDVPACWTAAVSEQNGIEVHQLRDPRLGLGEVRLVAAAVSDTRNWNRSEADFAIRLRQGAAETRRYPGVDLVRSSYSQHDTQHPLQYFDWFARLGDRNLDLTLRVNKALLGSPKLAPELAAMEAAVASARLDGPAGDCR